MKRIICLMLMALMLCGCSAPSNVNPDVTPTLEPISTQAPTPAPTIALTVAPTQEPTPAPIVGYVDANSLNMRAAASRDADIIQEYTRNQPLKIVGEEGDWYKVAIAAATGYMLKEYVALGEPQAEPATTDKHTKAPDATPDATKAPEQTDVPTAAPTVEPTAEPTHEQTPEPIQSTNGTIADLSPSQYAGKYVGSSESDKYHWPSCKSAQKILIINAVWWDTVEAAQAAGYKACKSCDP